MLIALADALLPLNRDQTRRPDTAHASDEARKERKEKEKEEEEEKKRKRGRNERRRREERKGRKKVGKEEEKGGRRGEKRHVTVEVSVGAAPRYTSSW